MLPPITEVLDQYDGVPYLHIRQDKLGQIYYCHWLDLLPEGDLIAVTPITPEELIWLKQGKLPLRDILVNPRTRTAVANFVDEDGKSIDKYVDWPIKEECLPWPGITLHRR